MITNVQMDPHHTNETRQCISVRLDCGPGAAVCAGLGAGGAGGHLGPGRGGQRRQAGGWGPGGLGGETRPHAGQLPRAAQVSQGQAVLQSELETKVHTKVEGGSGPGHFPHFFSKKKKISRV